jgi:hypothetical protein
MQTLLRNLQPLLINRSLEWEEQVVAQGLLVKGLGKQLVARTDELIYARYFFCLCCLMVRCLLALACMCHTLVKFISWIKSLVLLSQQVCNDCVGLFRMSL